MRILVLADIHANWMALSAIQETYDACLVVGDLVDYGTDPVPCIDWVHRHANGVVRGNHDHAVAQRVVGRGASGFRRLAATVRPQHWDVLSPQHLKYLGRLPVMQHVQVGDIRFLLVHATPRDPLDEYLGADQEQWRQRLTGVNANIVCVGHSHIPFQLQVDETQVLNPGSVGQPRDGDPRACYAIIEDGVISIRRVEYDIEAAINQVRSTGLPDWVVRFNAAIWKSGGRLTREEMDAIT